MFDLINANVVEFLMLIGFVVLLKTGDVFDKRTERLLVFSVPVILALIIVDMWDSHFATLETLNRFRYLTSALGYTLRPVALGIFITILLRKDDSVKHIWIPILFIAVVSLTSYWTHIMFWFTEDNIFQRGPLGYLAHIMAFAYMGVLAYYLVRRFKITDTGEVFAILYIIVTCLIAVILETVFGMKFVLTGTITSSCMVYYTYLYAQVYKTDPLTKAYNRTTFDKDAEKKTNKPLDIINIDLDGLKALNDAKGHFAGDKALTTLVDLLLKEAGNKYRVYRVGGDEFYVIGYTSPGLSSKRFIDNMTKALSLTPYRASFGYSTFKPGEDFVDCCMSADQNMYIAKAKRKESIT